eukprot:3834022-Pyramimonas_sp.AAC.1
MELWAPTPPHTLHQKKPRKRMSLWEGSSLSGTPRHGVPNHWSLGQAAVGRPWQSRQCTPRA